MNIWLSYSFQTTQKTNTFSKSAIETLKKVWNMIRVSISNNRVASARYFTHSPDVSFGEFEYFIHSSGVSFVTANLIATENLAMFRILAFQKADTSKPGFVLQLLFRTKLYLTTFWILILPSQVLGKVHGHA